MINQVSMNLRRHFYQIEEKVPVRQNIVKIFENLRKLENQGNEENVEFLDLVKRFPARFGSQKIGIDTSENGLVEV